MKKTVLLTAAMISCVWAKTLATFSFDSSTSPTTSIITTSSLASTYLQSDYNSTIGLAYYIEDATGRGGQHANAITNTVSDSVSFTTQMSDTTISYNGFSGYFGANRMDADLTLSYSYGDTSVVVGTNNLTATTFTEQTFDFAEFTTSVVVNSAKSNVCSVNVVAVKLFVPTTTEVSP